MARITIEIDTQNESFREALLNLASVGDRLREIQNAEEDEGERPLARHTQDAETPAPAPRKRRTKAEMAAANGGAAPTVESEPDTTGAPSASTGDQVSLDQVNDRIRDLMTSGTPALKLQELVKAATDGQYGSANKAFAEGGQEALDAIWAGLEALNG